MILGHHNTQLFRKVAIIGVGLMGGSLGMAIKKHRLAREVVGISRQHSSLGHALKNRAIDRATHDIKKGVYDADLIVLATPVKAILSAIPTLNGSLKRGCIVTDVGSVKAPIIDAAHKHLANVLFVGSHPLAGSEKKGVNFASAELFEKTICILTPTEKTNKSAQERIKALWTKLGATVKLLSPADHDKMAGYISHIPHLVAYALMGLVPSQYLEYASQGLKDTTRIASSDPQMWKDICMSNAKNILRSLDEYVKILSTFRRAIASKNEQNLIEQFKDFKNKRDGLL